MSSCRLQPTPARIDPVEVCPEMWTSPNVRHAKFGKCRFGAAWDDYAVTGTCFESTVCTSFDGVGAISRAPAGAVGCFAFHEHHGYSSRSSEAGTHWHNEHLTRDDYVARATTAGATKPTDLAMVSGHADWTNRADTIGQCMPDGRPELATCNRGRTGFDMAGVAGYTGGMARQTASAWAGVGPAELYPGAGIPNQVSSSKMSPHGLVPAWSCITIYILLRAPASPRLCHELISGGIVSCGSPLVVHHPWTWAQTQSVCQAETVVHGTCTHNPVRVPCTTMAFAPLYLTAVGW